MSVRNAIDIPTGTAAVTLPLWASTLTAGLQLTAAAIGVFLVLIRVAIAVGDWRRLHPGIPLCSRAAVRQVLRDLRHTPTKEG